MDALFKNKKDIINQLRREILSMQGYKPAAAGHSGIIGLGSVEAAFANSVFPTGVLHEFLTPAPEQAAACAGFIAGLLKTLMKQGGACIWISACRMIFPPSLNAFGIEPDQIIFIDLKWEKEILWATEEALKCDGLIAVVADIREMNLVQSRRLQLTVEQSKVTGFILRNDLHKFSTTACVARWQISPLASELEIGMPGVGFPRWKVELLKVRNGNPGSWEIEWAHDHFNVQSAKSVKAYSKLEEREAG